MFSKISFLGILCIFVIVSLLCICSCENTQPSIETDKDRVRVPVFTPKDTLKYTITKGKSIAKIRIYHSKRDMLNDVVIEPEIDHVKVLHQNTSLTISIPKPYSITDIEMIPFDEITSKLPESGKKIEYLISLPYLLT